MATKYVRKSGSDSNGGTSPSDAWLTVGKAIGASGIASGDTVIIGPGVYRAVLSVAMTSAVAETFVTGDPTGGLTGDTPGEVRITAYTTNDTSAPSATTLLDLAGRDHLTFSNITFQPGSANPSLLSVSTGTSTDIKFSSCTFLLGSNQNRFWDLGIAANTAINWTFDKCRFFVPGSGFRFQPATSASADYDINVQFTNCLLLGMAGIVITGSGVNSFKGGGLKIDSCTILTGATAISVGNANISTTFPVTVYNSLIFSNSQQCVSANTLGQIIEDNNVFYAAAPRNNVTAGASSRSDVAFLVEIGQSLVNFGLCRPVGMPTSDSPAVGFGAHAGGPSDDILGKTRSAPFAAGAYEFSTPPNRSASRVFAGF